MNKAKIYYPFGATFLDYPDNCSHAILIYFVGCSHYCIGCHNPVFQNENYEKAIEVNVKQFYNDIFTFAKKHNTNKIVLSGGDPLFINNRDFTREFVSNYRHIFDICIYTGYEVEQVKSFGITGFKFLKTGQYKESLKQESVQSDNFMQLASKNQKIYNSNYTLISRDGVLNFK